MGRNWWTRLFLNTLEPWAASCLPTWVSKVLTADSTIPSSLPPTALDFRLGLSLEDMGAPKIRSWGDIMVALRFEHPRGHIIFTGLDLEGNPGFNLTPPLTCCGTLVKSFDMQP